MKYREKADYNPSYAFTPEDYERLKAEVAAVSGDIQDHLAAQGMV